MAPSFFQKLVKVATPGNANTNAASTRDRVSSDAYSTTNSNSPNDSVENVRRSRAFSASAVSPTTPTQTNVSSISRRTSSSGSQREYIPDNRIPSIITTLSGRKRSKSGAKENEKEKDREREKEKAKSLNSKKRTDRSSSRSRETLQPKAQAGDRTSWGSADTFGTQPNVTIVPPSPLVRNGALELDSDDDEGKSESGRDSVRNRDEVESEQSEDVATPTLPKHSQGPSAVSPSSNNKPGSSVPSTPSTPTPLTFSNNTTINTNNSNSSPMPTLTPGSYTVRKQPSNKSIGKKGAQAPSEINIAVASATANLGNSTNGASNNGSSLNNGNNLGGHLRSTTTPGEAGGGGSNEQTNNGAVTMKPIVESPTDLKFPSSATSTIQTNRTSGGTHNITPSNSTSTTGTTTSTSTTSASGSASTANLSLNRENTNASVLSVGDGGKSKRPWRKSTTRKPTGLASAIAASGLAMANPSLSPAHTAATTNTVLNATEREREKDRDPYLSRSPAESNVSQSHHKKSRSAASASGDLSPRSSKSRKSSIGSPGRSSTGGGRRGRRSSSAAHSTTDGNSEYHTSINGTSTTLNGDDHSIRPDYYTGIGADSGSDDEDDSDDTNSDVSSMLDIDEDIPVTGFAVASNKRNADFHELFPTVPEGDYLIEDYGCALQREILIQGRIYISENHICFHANIFGWITDLSIPIYEITSLEKKMTAFVIPNAIQITTRQAKYTFASFLSRDTTFDVIYNIWRLARPEDGNVGNGSYVSSGRGSMDNSAQGAGVSGAGGAATTGAGVPGSTGAVVPQAIPAHKATQCTCGKENKHFTETAMDVVLPGTPEKIHNLMFASGFIKDFMSGNQKLLDIQMSDWAPVSPGSKLLTRNFSYIKPLNGSLGPKQTKCELKDEVAFCDFDQYVSTVTTTRTPDVPSGGVFAVKTRTCITWASAVSSRVTVTTQVEWTGRSFIRGIIERSAIDGQKVYHIELEKCMRQYIQEHKSEFLPEGVDTVPEPATAGVQSLGEVGDTGTIGVDEKTPSPEELKQRERERNARSLQWAYDTFDGAWQVARRSTKGALELVRDAWDQSSSTTILWFAIVILVMSNIWTLVRSGKRRGEVEEKLVTRRTEERERWVQSVVTALWEEMASVRLQNQQQQTLFPGQVINTIDHPSVPSTVDVAVPPSVPTDDLTNMSVKEELSNLMKTLDAVEERVKIMRESLNKLDALD